MNEILFFVQTCFICTYLRSLVFTHTMCIKITKKRQYVRNLHAFYWFPRMQYTLYKYPVYSVIYVYKYLHRSGNRICYLKRRYQSDVLLSRDLTNYPYGFYLQQLSVNKLINRLNNTHSVER